MIFLEILTLVTIGLSLSIDAFALSCIYGILNHSNKKIYLVSFITGCFHFLMPILGFLISKYVNNYIDINTKYVLLIVLFIILFEMVKSLREDDTNISELKLVDMFVFAFLVSIDSFSLGLGINYITNNIVLASIIFAIMSSTFTFLGFKLGKYISNKFRKLSKYVGIIILFTIIIYILCKV